ncbi:MAG: GH92 family glycosyl hydrolase [Mucilaginibacter sp.]
MKQFCRCSLIAIIAISTIFSASAQRKKDYTQFVDPFIGTGGHGHTFPGAVRPFGMVQLSPDTRYDGWDACSGYYYADTTVYGFSHTHLSGTGIPDYCDVLFMPTVGKPQFLNTQYKSGFKKKNESATPGYYKTFLDKYKIGVELTATTRVGMHRYTYPSTKEANIIIDLQPRDSVRDSWIEVVNDHEIRGMRRSSGWADDQYVFFYAKFSKPFKSYGIAVNDQLQPGKTKAEGNNIKMYVRFDNPGEVIAKVGISDVSADGALKNLDAEVPDFDFKKVQHEAKAAWNTELSKIDIEGGAPAASAMNPPGMPAPQPAPGHKKVKEPVVDRAHQKQVMFYTALYHCMIAPNIYNDVDGRYRGMDQKIHKAEGFNYYTVFSLWDTYRAEDPLFNLIDRKRTLDFVKSFLAMYDQGGVLPVWPLASNETYCMVGTHSIPVIADAYMKGITGFDTEAALKAMKASVNRKQFGYDVYANNGAVLADDENESVSKTLEYAIDDWCIAQMAKGMGKQNDYAEYIQRAQYWKNVFNDQHNFMEARTNGGWYEPFDPYEINDNYTEGNAWQYAFLVPQDVEGLKARMGGEDKFEKKLSELFTTSSKLTGKSIPDVAGMIGQYAHGDEPSHHMAYLFNFTNSPEKTQYYVNKVLNEQYRDDPDGLSGNEDCGQMSAWYVMSALGIYNTMPGQQQFQIGMPQFEKATIHLENGKKFTISNSGMGISLQNIYLQGMNLNKQAYNKIYIDYNTIMKGGDLELFTGRLPNKMFEQGLEKPTSVISDHLIVSNPYIISPSKAFQKPFNAVIKCSDKDAKIYYTLDGSPPNANATLYTVPIPVNSSITIKAIAIKNGKSSFVDVANFNKIRDDVTLKLLTNYLPTYAGEGKYTLINGVHGKTNWHLGNWQAWQKDDLVAVLDFGQVKPIGKISLGTLQDTRSWIVFPRYVQYWASDDGKNYKLVTTVDTKVDVKDLTPQTQEFKADLHTNARYIKIIAKQYGPLPEWHDNHGSPSYIFADEISID